MTEKNEDREDAVESEVAKELDGVPEEFLSDDGDEDAEEDGADDNEVAELREELEKVQQDVLYAKADTQNVRRRMEKDISELEASSPADE